MSRSVKIGLATAGAVLILLVAGNIWFVALDDRRAAGFKFALFEPEQALKQITQKAEASKSLVGSGIGVVIPAKASGSLGATRWTVSPDGLVQGTASERGLAVVWTPELKEGKVEWRCTAEPKRDFTPGTCDGIQRFER